VLTRPLEVAGAGGGMTGALATAVGAVTGWTGPAPAKGGGASGEAGAAGASLAAGAWLPAPAVSCARTPDAANNEKDNKVNWTCLVFMGFNLLGRRLGVLRDDPVTAPKLLGKPAPTGPSSGEKNGVASSTAPGNGRRNCLAHNNRPTDLPNFTFAQYASTTSAPS